jgi:hypothetical protein
MTRVGLTVAALAIFAAACGGGADYTAERADVVAEVRPDGSVDIREALTIRFDSGATRFTRDVDLDRADDVEWLGTSVDGRAIEPGAPAEVTVTVANDDGLTVTWTFTAIESASRTFELAYRVRGAVAVRGRRGALVQTLLPTGRPYRIEASRVRLVVPAGMRVFDGTAGVAEAGWTVVAESTGITAERTNLGVDDGATVMAEVSIDPGVIVEPEWQRYTEWTTELIPAFMAGGLFILVIGAGILWIIRFQYPRRRADGARAATDDEERRVVRAGLRTGGLAVAAFAVVLSGVVWVALGHFGAWPLALPVAMFVVGVVFVVVSPRYV